MRISLWFQLFIAWLPQPVISEISWLFPDFFLTSVKFSWPTELKVLQTSPENGLNAPLTAIPTAHLFMLSGSHMQNTWTDSSLTYRAKRIDFLENPTSAFCSISWTIFYQYNTIHACNMYKCTLEISLFLTVFQRLKFSLTWSVQVCPDKWSSWPDIVRWSVFILSHVVVRQTSSQSRGNRGSYIIKFHWSWVKRPHRKKLFLILSRRKYLSGYSTNIKISKIFVISPLRLRLPNLAKRTAEYCPVN